MTEQQLLERIEQQAVRIAALETGLKEATELCNRLIDEAENKIPQLIYQQMAKAAVNCGPRYGCALAARMIQ